MRRWIILLAFMLFAAGRLAGDVVMLHCWIVGDDRGNSEHTMESITDKIGAVNRIYRQVGMLFFRLSVSETNSTYLTNVQYGNWNQVGELCDLASNTGGVEVYFVNSITNLLYKKRITAFAHKGGIVIGPDANVVTVAHEIGHICGLKDIYTSSNGTELKVEGPPSDERMPRDSGFYPANVTHADIVQRLLMYGSRSLNKGDISGGDIYGLTYTNRWNSTTQKWDKDWFLGMVPVGFWEHGNRNPQSE